MSIHGSESRTSSPAYLTHWETNGPNSEPIGAVLQ